MKKLILILILLPLLGISQGIIATMNTFPPVDTLSIDQEIEKLLVISYSNYEKECYNDSILNQGENQDNSGYVVGYITAYNLIGTTSEGSFCIRDGKSYVYPPVNGYLHKQPTFEGYIQWLRRKYD